MIEARRPRPLLALLLAALAATARTVAAQQPESRAQPDAIAVVVQRPDHPVAVRLRAELETVGFRVIVVQESAQPPARESLEATAREAGAVAAVRIVASKKGVEVWVADRVTGKTVLREVVVAEGSGPGASGTIALRAVELLRASLMEVEAAHETRGEVEPSPPVRAAVSTPDKAPPPPAPLPDPLFAAQLGPAIAVASGGLGVSVHTLVDFRWLPGRWIGIDAFALAPTIPSRLEATEGTSIVTIGLLGGGVHVAFASLLRFDAPPGGEPRWTPTAGAGLAGAWLHFEGAAEPPYLGQDDDVFTWVPYVRGGLGLSIVSRLRLRGDLLAGVAVPRPVIRFAGREAAGWGPPLLVASIGAEVAWP